MGIFRVFFRQPLDISYEQHSHGHLQPRCFYLVGADFHLEMDSVFLHVVGLTSRKRKSLHRTSLCGTIVFDLQTNFKATVFCQRKHGLLLEKTAKWNSFGFFHSMSTRKIDEENRRLGKKQKLLKSLRKDAPRSLYIQTVLLQYNNALVDYDCALGNFSWRISNSPFESIGMFAHEHLWSAFPNFWNIG